MAVGTASEPVLFAITLLAGKFAISANATVPSDIFAEFTALSAIVTAPVFDIVASPLIATAAA